MVLPAGAEPVELDADYRAAGFAAPLGFGQRSALLVVDAVRAYTDPASSLWIDAELAVAAMVRLVRAARRAGLPVVIVHMAPRVDGASPSVLEQKVPALALLLEGETAGPVAGLEPESGDIVIRKTGASAFFGTDLADVLRRHGVDTCLITGFSTSGCVRATAVDAVQNGFRPLVVEEATADRADAVKRATLFDLGAKYADVIPEADALAHIGSGSAS